MKRKAVKCLLACMIFIGLLVGCGREEAKESSLAESEQAAVSETVEAVSFDYNDLVGHYQDSVSGRASLDIRLNDDRKSVIITVNWAESAFITDEWTMTAEESDGRLVYSDCALKRVGADKEEVYENEEGYFTLENGVLLWDGAADESCKECRFEVIPNE